MVATGEAAVIEETPRRNEDEDSEAQAVQRVQGALFAGLILLPLIPILIGLFLWQRYDNYFVPGDAMTPTLDVSDRLLIRDTGAPERGDIIIHSRVGDGSSEVPRRVIGLPGEVVSIEDGMVFIDSVALDEPYLPEGTETPSLGSDTPVEVPPDHYFVLGDNRATARDSRVEGMVSEEAVRGTVSGRWWPLTSLGQP